ncbi:hypothetical protein EYF80_006722 [Liparis tanakae]|uniref:Uncharacterized protein n=1 Tax=Liparis tanakae TaxID=230148 RepID=A0A4Z2IYP5_9TELE|nr:hypothetical protein EYF80_006722 [Liparis tanakae]
MNGLEEGVSLTCGTHFGDTKLVASMTDSPDADSMSIKWILVSVGTMVWGWRSNKKRSTDTQAPLRLHHERSTCSTSEEKFSKVAFNKPLLSGVINLRDDTKDCLLDLDRRARSSSSATIQPLSLSPSSSPSTPNKRAGSSLALSRLSMGMSSQSTSWMHVVHMR